MLFSWKSRRVDVFQAHTRRTIFLAQVQCLFCNIIFIIICIHIFSISWLKSSFWMLAWFGDLEKEREKRYLQLSPHPYFEHTISHQNKHKHKKEQISIKKTHKYLNANKMWKTKYGKVGAEVLRSAHSTDTWLTRLPIYWSRSQNSARFPISIREIRTTKQETFTSNSPKDFYFLQCSLIYISQIKAGVTCR